MINFLSSLDSILVNVLVVIGVLIIVSGAIKTLWEFIQYETKRKKQKDTIEEFRQFSLIRSHLTISIILALPLFIIKFLDDVVKAQSQTAYLYLLALVVILAIMIFSYKKDKNNVPKK